MMPVSLDFAWVVVPTYEQEMVKGYSTGRDNQVKHK